MKSTVTSTANSLKQQAHDALHRGLDRHVRLAVTGLRRAGKTAFITGLIEQLLHANEGAALGFFDVVREGRLVASQLTPSPQWQIPRFKYEQAIEALCGQPSRWPESTNSLSQIRLTLRYQPTGHWNSRWLSYRDLTLDIVDYPGEWLLDLPLLSLDYEAWSQQQSTLLERPERAKHAQAWLQSIRSELASEHSADDSIRRIAEQYQLFLAACRDQSQLCFLQPGRMLMPGELAGAPALHFFPWPQQFSCPEHWQRLLVKRYQHYQQQVIKPFYQSYFSHFNRQVILVDLLDALQAGEQAFADRQEALAALLESFSYGENHWLRRLFSARIERVALVATKADQVPPNQHHALAELLRQLLLDKRRQWQFDNVPHEVFSVASLAATSAGEVDGQQVVQGVDENGQTRRVAPSALPQSTPTAQQWQKGFQYLRFAPNFSRQQIPLPHQRLDKVLQYLVGDKLT